MLRARKVTENIRCIGYGPSGRQRLERFLAKRAFVHAAVMLQHIVFPLETLMAASAVGLWTVVLLDSLVRQRFPVNFVLMACEASFVSKRICLASFLVTSKGSAVRIQMSPSDVTRSFRCCGVFTHLNSESVRNWRFDLQPL